MPGFSHYLTYQPQALLLAIKRTFGINPKVLFIADIFGSHLIHCQRWQRVSFPTNSNLGMTFQQDVAIDAAELLTTGVA